VPQAIASIITSPNGSGQSIGNSSAAAPPIADLADVLDQRMVQQRLDHLVEIPRVGEIDLGGHLQRHAQALGDLDRLVGPLLGRHAAEEGEVALARPGAEPASELGFHAVVDGADPVGERQVRAL
jgi:hypothetical protein